MAAVSRVLMAIRARFSAGNGRVGVGAEWGIRSEWFWGEGEEGRGRARVGCGAGSLPEPVQRMKTNDPGWVVRKEGIRKKKSGAGRAACM
jgi:hypothetical protein